MGSLFWAGAGSKIGLQQDTEFSVSVLGFISCEADHGDIPRNLATEGNNIT